MRTRRWAALSVVSVSMGLLAACGFGVDLDGLFGGQVGPGDGATPDVTTDGAVESDASIPKVQVV